MNFTPEDVRERLRGQPFVPVRIVTTTGNTYDVHHPDLVMVGRRYLIVGLPSTDNPAVFEQVTRIPLIHLAKLQDAPPVAGPPSNGSPNGPPP